ncbi:MAG: hypothetical protein Q4D26_07785 [Clostridia bacterium]|nr:hypothetical protein [Clostridia bacterium]
MKFKIYEQQIFNNSKTYLLADFGFTSNDEKAKQIFISTIKSQKNLIDYINTRKLKENIDITYILYNCDTNNIILKLIPTSNNLINSKTGELI